MANPGVGTKFLSVNLNKSYGQSHHQHHNNQHNLSHLGHHGSNRSRPGGGGGAGGGGGMVVLSRPRSSQKATGPKLSVPPPLNLPSLRKEHERFDSLGSTGGSAGGGVSGGGQRPGSSGMGWTKPGTAVTLQEKGGIVIGNHVTDDVVDQGLHGVDGVSKVSGSSGTYMPPSLRSGLVEPPSSTFPHVEKVSVLRGEDFPSLRAALPSLSISEKKHRDGLNQKQKQAMGEEYGNSDQNHGSRLNSLVDLHPRLKSGGFDNGLSENGGRNRDLGGSGGSEQIRKQDEYFPGPLPLVRLNPRSDWADDERDTGHGFAVQDRDHGSSRSEAYRDRDFDMPRPSGLPHKPAHNVFDRWSQHDNETGKVSSSEVTEVDPFGRDTRTPGREGQERNLWRASPPLQKDAFGAQEFGNDRNSFGARPYSQNREAIRENKLVSSSFRDLPSDDFGKRDLGHVQAGRQPWNNTWHSSYSQRAERNDQYNKFRGDSFQNNSVSKSSLSSGGRGLPVNDPILNFGRDKRAAMKSDKPYLEDPFMKDFGATGFDVRDPFSGGLVGVVKKKKDLKQTDFHDPVRESFEAELERVQKMQEQERQRIIEEQERALDLARREEEERLRVAREQEEQRRRLEEEARETAWRAEQERLEAMRKAEEQRIAREEEKQRIIMEEERRKQAAKQKLLELEERIAKRQVEGTKCGSNSSILAEEKISGMSPKLADLVDWEDGERIVERITTSASSDSSGLNRAFDLSNRPRFARDNSSALLERGKPVNSWRRDAFENGNSSTFFPQESDNGHFSPRRGGTIGGKSFPRKDYFGGPGFMSSRTYYKAGVQESHTDEVNHPRSQRWNIPGDGDHYARNVEVESDFHENYTEGYSDVGWGHSQYHSNPYPSYPERLYQNPDIDGLSSSGRSRYSMRHPRVLPPPSRSVMQKTFYRHENEQPGPSNFQENEIEYNHAERSETTGKIGFESSDQHNLAQPEIIDVQLENTANLEQKMDRNTTTRCDSQSSLSVSSPPDSPVHLSHDDLDESGDSPALSANEDTDISPGRGNDRVMLPMESRKENTVIHSSSVSVDDEEWTIENERLQEQEEYDEDEDGYEEEDEIHDGDDENINLTQEFEEMHLVEKISPDMVNNVVLGFNEGVEVAMPTDEIERSPQNEESSFSAPTTVVEGLGSFDVVCGTLHSVDVPSKAITGDSSRIFREAEKAIQDLVIQPSSTQLSAVSELMVHVDANSDSVVSNQQPISSSVDITSHSSSNQTVTSAISAGPCQAEPPVKLQFGLFSGPSLIPSPIPAIQIGSIQMPLLHPQVGPSLAHMHTSQSSLFQFRQLRYSSPISQGVLPLAPQSAPLVQSNISATFSMTQNAAVSQPILSSSETSLNLMKSDALSLSVDNQPGLAQRCLDLSEGNVLNKVTSLPASERAETTFMAQQDCPEVSHLGEEKTGSDSGLRVQDRGHHISVMRNFKSLSKESENLLQTRAASSLSGSKEKMLNVPKTQGLISGGRSKKYVVSVRNNAGSKSSFVAPETSRSDSGGFQRRPRHQRTEFRVRENTDKQLYTGVASTNQIALDDKSNINGRGTGFSTRSEYRRVIVSNKSSKQMNESESMNSGITSSQEIDSGGKTGKAVRRGSSTKSKNIPHFVEGNLKRTIHTEEDVDTPLQSGVVRVFEQPGIEAPSDEDDFIEVRSKRQMLNDRREQREKEIKAKSRFTKMPRKSRSTSQNSLVSASSNKISVSMSEAANDVPPDFVATDGRNSANLEVSTGFGATKVSQLLAPIGTPAVKTEVQADIRPQTIKCLQKSSVSVLSGGEKNLASGFIFDSKNKVLDNVQTPMGLWGNSRLDQQVMALSQNQLDEAMNPGQFDSRVSSKDHSSVGEPSIPSSTILTEDKSFSSAASPINSLLAGEKIQFGAVTSPTVLPPSTRAVSHGIGPPGPGRSEHQIAHNISAAKNDRTIFFDKEKRSNETCVNLEDCEAEAEAEAAASAIAVAAISSDEIVGNGLGTCSVSVSEAISIGCAEIDGVAGGDKQSLSQSKAEESLTVALPADLSVETPPISLWPPLPSPPNSSSQMVSHFAGGPPSHFPFYEMNPMLGGPIFTFGPHDESAPSQSPTQKSNAPSSTPLRTWQQCHSGVDSFYGAPTGYAGPFISPSGGLPGVQGPPHMVVYNHFAPVGQFGQVGLSFMGATYIPSAKQPDWKRHPVSSAMGVGEGEVNNLNMVAAQRNPTNLTAPIQHLAPGSPLMPMASTLAMFDVSPFQSASDMSVQAHWSNVTPAPHQPVSISMPLQQQPDGVLPLQYNYGPPVDQSSNANRSQTSTPSDSSRNFHAVSDATVTQLPDELGLVDSASSAGPGTSTQNVVAKSLSLSTITDAGKSDIVQNSSSSNVPQSSQQKNTSSHQYNSSSGYSYQRGSGISQKNSSGGEWAHRRIGFNGRNQSLSTEKGFGPAKMKQIYVAKQTTSGTSAPS